MDGCMDGWMDGWMDMYCHQLMVINHQSDCSLLKLNDCDLLLKPLCYLIEGRCSFM